jgi:type I restriction enzyme S subunit
LSKLQVPIPPLPEQRAIAELLGALDDKVESNRRMGGLLDDLMEGEFRASLSDEPVLAAEVLVPILGGTPRRDESSYWNGDVPWASAKDVTAHEGSVILETAETISAEGVRNSAAKILPAGTTVLTARGTVGAMARLGTPMSFNQTCYGLLPSGGASPLEVYWSMRLAVAELKRMTHGTVFDTITKATFSSLELRLPRAEVREGTLARLVGLDARMQASLRESMTLAQLRDALLPALLSGRIRVPVAADLVDA